MKFISKFLVVPKTFEIQASFFSQYTLFMSFLNILWKHVNKLTFELHVSQASWSALVCRFSTIQMPCIFCKVRITSTQVRSLCLHSHPVHHEHYAPSSWVDGMSTCLENRLPGLKSHFTDSVLWQLLRFSVFLQLSPPVKQTDSPKLTCFGRSL